MIRGTRAMAVLLIGTLAAWVLAIALTQLDPLGPLTVPLALIAASGTLALVVIGFLWAMTWFLDNRPR